MLRTARRAAACVVACVIVLLAARPAAAQQADGLHVASTGSGRPVIVVLHGGPGVRHDYMRPEWDALGQMGTLVYYDQRGCGRSTRAGPHAWRQHVLDLHDVLAAFSADGPAVLAGSSWGTLLALLYTLEHPDRVAALVLSGVPPWPDSAQVRRAFDALDSADRHRYESLVSSAASAVAEIDSASIAAGGPPGLAARLGPSCTDAGRATWYSLHTAPPADDLRRLDVPALIIHGAATDRSMDGAVSLHDVLPRSTLLVLPDTGHNPWLDVPAVFFEAVAGFLDEARR